jgi:hypothetical protein
MIFAGTFVLMPEAGAQRFKGSPCTQDCSGHEAGYKWAERQAIADESDCGGTSNSFIEGCRSYVEENASEDEDKDGKEND